MRKFLDDDQCFLVSIVEIVREHSRSKRIIRVSEGRHTRYAALVADTRSAKRIGTGIRMDEQITEELLAELLDSPTLEEFLENNDEAMMSLPDYLQALLEEKGLKRSSVIRDANLNATFGYQIFTGARGAGRDTILQLAFAMRLTLRETNRLLQAAGANGLYCKSRRDGIIIFCIDHGASLQKTNEELYRFDEETIC